MPVTKEERREAAKVGMTSTQPDSAADKPPLNRIIGSMAKGEGRIHPDDLMYPLGFKVLQNQYAPTLAEFEAKFGPLAPDSYTRRQYMENEAQKPTTEQPSPPPSAKK